MKYRALVATGKGGLKMGGRGSAGGKGGAAGEGLSFGGAPALDTNLVRRANAAGAFVDYGDATAREYQKNVGAINASALSASEKSAAIKELHTLTENQLRAESKAVSPYTSGVARFNKTQVERNAETAATARAKTNNFMKNLQNKSAEITKKTESANLATALSNASKAGQLEVKVGNKTYYRKRKNSSSWYVK